MTDKANKINDAEKLPDRRDVLKITAAAGLTALLPIPEMTTSPLAAPALSARNAKGLQALYSIMGEGHTFGSRLHYTPDGVEVCKDIAHSILKDKGASLGLRDLLQSIIDLPDDAGSFYTQSKPIVEMWRKVMPELHEAAVRKYKEEEHFWRDERVGKHDSHPDDSSKRQDENRTSLPQEPIKAKKSEPETLRDPLLSEDSENVYRRMHDVITKGKTGDEPFVETLLQERRSILPRR